MPPMNLNVTTPTDRQIVMTRTFDAPPRLVWEAMSKPELVRRWLLGPPGWTLSTCEIDPRVGNLLPHRRGAVRPGHAGAAAAAAGDDGPEQAGVRRPQ